MYEIHFYKDKSGNEPVKEYIAGLASRKDRILFAAWNGNGFILLHIFMKQTQKTPPREIERAKRNLTDYHRREHDENE